MKELDSFTVERLEELSTKENIPELAALARIALAAKRAEPVAWEVNGILCHTKEEADSYVGEPAPLYDEPQLNSPEIRKLILGEIGDFCAGLDQPGEPELPEDIQQVLMNRIELVFNNCG